MFLVKVNGIKNKKTKEFKGWKLETAKINYHKDYNNNRKNRGRNQDTYRFECTKKQMDHYKKQLEYRKRWKC